MNSKALLIFTVCCSHTLFGQTPTIQDTSIINHRFELNGNIDYFSTSIPVAISRKFFQGGFITPELIDNAYAKHKNINIFGTMLTGEIEYQNHEVPIDSKGRWGWLLKAGTYNYASIGYGKDLFGTVFKGTKPFLGEKQEFNGTSFVAGAFQKFGFGIVNKKTKSNFTLNLIHMSNYSNAYIRKGSLFQLSDSTSVNLILSGDYTQKLKSNTPSMGVAIDIDLRIPVKLADSTKQIYLQLYASNIGFAVPAVTKRYVVNENLNYSGFELNQLLDSTLQNKTQDEWLDSLGVQSTRKARVIGLPSLIQLAKIIDGNNLKKIQFFGGVRIMPNITFIPNSFIGIHYRASKNFSTGIQASYGGFGGYRTGWYSSLKLKSVVLSAGTENVLGVISKKAHGESFTFKAIWKI